MKERNVEMERVDSAEGRMPRHTAGTGGVEVVVAEPVAVEVVGPEPAVDESAVAAQFTAQYRRAEGARGAFMREAVAFGAMLICAERLHGSFSAAAEKLNNLSKRGRNGEGRPNSGIGEWLAEHCPEINYKTAQGYKAMTMKVVEMMGGATAEVLAALRSPDERSISYEDEGGELREVGEWAIYRRGVIFGEASSRRRLELAYASWLRMPDCDGGDREPPPKLSRREAAAAVWAKVMSVISRTAVAESVRFLPPDVAKVCRERLAALVDELRGQSEPVL